MTSISFRTPITHGTQLETKRPQLSPMLPHELSLEIFKFLDLKDLGRVPRLCRGWKELASTEILWKAFDLKKLFPKLSVIDKDVWEKHVDLKMHGLSFEGEELIDRRRLIQGLYEMFITLPMQYDTGITLISIPQGLTFDKLREATQCINGCISDHFSSYSRNDLVTNIYQIAITDCVLRQSGGLSSDAQQDLVKKFKSAIPQVLEASTWSILTSINSIPESLTFLALNASNIYTSCSKIENYFFVVGHVGSGEKTRLNVTERNLAHPSQGIKALRRFTGADSLIS